MRAPRLTELIDLEAQLRVDADLEPEELRARDGAIGARIEAATLDDRTATLRWLEAVRAPDGQGAQAEHRRHQLAALLCVVGFAFGALSVGGWLATDASEPVNVVYFWPAFVGVQIILALGFWLAIVPPAALARVPLVGALHGLLQGLASAIPRLAGRLLGRFSHAGAERYADTLAELRRLDWLYGRLRFWSLVHLTQLFAVAFNCGALGAFVVLPTIDDPAFGWRSRLLDERQVERASAAIALPWRQAWPAAVPSREVIAATRHSSVAERYAPPDPSFGDGGDGGNGADRADPVAAATNEAAVDPGQRPWAAWWPFLLASVAVYGLIPRLLYLGLALQRARRARQAVPFDRVEIRRLLARLRQPVVATAGVGAERSGAWTTQEDAVDEAGWPAPERTLAFRWAGVDLTEEGLAGALAERFGQRPDAIHAIGEVEGEGDEAALAALEAAPEDEGLYIVVGAWEPPVGDHLDLLDAMRARGGRTRPVLVTLVGDTRNGRASSPEARHRGIWEQALRRRGDPMLFVAPLVESDTELEASDG